MFVRARQNEILKEPRSAGPSLLELIGSLRRKRPSYKLTKHCLYLATVRPDPSAVNVLLTVS